MSEAKDILLVNYHRQAKHYLEGRSKNITVISTHSDGRAAEAYQAKNIYIAPDANQGKSYDSIMATLRTGQTGTCLLLDQVFSDEA